MTKEFDPKNTHDQRECWVLFFKDGSHTVWWSREPNAEYFADFCWAIKHVIANEGDKE